MFQKQGCKIQGFAFKPQTRQLLKVSLNESRHLMSPGFSLHVQKLSLSIVSSLVYSGDVFDIIGDSNIILVQIMVDKSV